MLVLKILYIKAAKYTSYMWIIESYFIAYILLNYISKTLRLEKKKKNNTHDHITVNKLFIKGDFTVFLLYVICSQ